jgi:hypothetical protein
MQSIEPTHGLHSVMAGGPAHSRLYKNKMIASIET